MSFTCICDQRKKAKLNRKIDVLQASPRFPDLPNFNRPDPKPTSAYSEDIYTDQVLNRTLPTPVVHETEEALIAKPKASQPKLIPLQYSWEEINMRREAGLCIFCEERETPDHHLMHKGIQLVIIDLENDEDEDELVEIEVGTESIENEVATDLIECEDRSVKNEANAKVISSSVKEESIPQFQMVTEAHSIVESDCVQHTNMILQHQVSISPLEHSFNFCKANLDVMGNCQYTMGRTHQIQSHSGFGCVNDDACQMFDVIPLKRNVSFNERKKTLLKCWRFKFKNRIAPRDVKSGFELKEKQNATEEYPCLLWTSNVAANAQILCVGEMKFNVDKLLHQLFLSILHTKRQRNTSKFHKTWKFRFKKTNLQRMTQLGCSDIMLHMTSKGIFRFLQLFSGLGLLTSINLWFSKAHELFGLLQNSSDDGAACVAAERPLLWLQKNSTKEHKVSEPAKKKKRICHKTWMFKYKTTLKREFLHSFVMEVLLDWAVLRIEGKEAHVDIKNYFSVWHCWRMKFKMCLNRLIDLLQREVSNKGCFDCFQALVLIDGITHNSSGDKELMKAEPYPVRVNVMRLKTHIVVRDISPSIAVLKISIGSSLSTKGILTFISQAEALLFDSDWGKKQIPTLQCLKQTNISHYR